MRSSWAKKKNKLQFCNFSFGFFLLSNGLRRKRRRRRNTVRVYMALTVQQTKMVEQPSTVPPVTLTKEDSLIARQLSSSSSSACYGDALHVYDGPSPPPLSASSASGCGISGSVRRGMYQSKPARERRPEAVVRSFLVRRFLFFYFTFNSDYGGTFPPLGRVAWVVPLSSGSSFGLARPD